MATQKSAHGNQTELSLPPKPQLPAPPKNTRPQGPRKHVMIPGARRQAFRR